MQKTTTKKTTKKNTKNNNELKVNEELFKVTLNFNGCELVFETENPAEAIMMAKPLLLKTKVVIYIEKDGKKAEKVLPPIIARRLWKLPTSFRAVITRLNFK